MNLLRNPILFLSLAAFMVGCGASSNAAPQSMASSDAQIQDMVKARAIYEASKDKNFDALPADQKAEYTRLVHASDEAGAKRWWATMSPAPPMGGGGAGASMGPR